MPEFLSHAIELFLHLDQHLDQIVRDFGLWSYAILFTIIFLETGIVLTPFLPGDSLLFAAGAIAARPGAGLNIWVLVGLLTVAAVLGDTVNYWIGKYAGTFMMRRFPRIVRQEHIDRTHAFFEKYGGMTIVIARFVPIVRTFAPFVAGIGAMNYAQFVAYNAIGGVVWVAICVGAGYGLGNIPIVKENFSLVVLVIIVLSILPGVVAYLRARRDAKRAPAAANAPAPGQS